MMDCCDLDSSPLTVTSDPNKSNCGKGLSKTTMDGVIVPQELIHCSLSLEQLWDFPLNQLFPFLGFDILRNHTYFFYPSAKVDTS